MAGPAGGSEWPGQETSWCARSRSLATAKSSARWVGPWRPRRRAGRTGGPEFAQESRASRHLRLIAACRTRSSWQESLDAAPSWTRH